MPAARTLELHDLSREVDAIIAGVVGGMREDVRALFHRLGDRFVREDPRDTGRAKSSIRPYAGAPSGWVPEDHQSFYGTYGAPDADAVVDAWRPGLEIGFESNVPYARRLANGWSRQAAAGWIALLVAEEVAAHMAEKG